MRVHLRGPKVKTLVRVDRAAFIGDLVQEIVGDLTDRQHPALDEIIETGIVKNQFLGQITVQYLVDIGSAVRPRQIAEVSIQIDWERFRINVAGLGEDLEIAPERGKIEQVSDVLVKLLRFLSDYRERTGARSTIVFQWAPGVDAARASEAMNTRQAESFAWVGGSVHDFGKVDSPVLKAADANAKSQKGAEYEITVTPERLDELRIVARFADEAGVQRLLGEAREESEET